MEVTAAKMSAALHCCLQQTLGNNANLLANNSGVTILGSPQYLTLLVKRYFNNFCYYWQIAVWQISITTGKRLFWKYLQLLTSRYFQNINKISAPSDKQIFSNIHKISAPSDKQIIWKYPPQLVNTYFENIHNKWQTDISNIHKTIWQTDILKITAPSDRYFEYIRYFWQTDILKITAPSDRYFEYIGYFWQTDILKITAPSDRYFEYIGYFWQTDILKITAPSDRYFEYISYFWQKIYFWLYLQLMANC